jgi:twinkle protein
MKKVHVLHSDNLEEVRETKHSDTIVRVLKNRYSGETGIACRLNYNLSTCKFNETTEPAEFDATTDF